MDDEDERLFALEKELYERGDKRGIIALYTHNLPMRLYEAEEQDVRQWHNHYVMQDDPSDLFDPSKGIYMMDLGVEYRLLRFFESLKGFHKGRVDLAGRFSHRYQSLFRRFIDFGQDFMKLHSRLPPGNNGQRPDVTDQGSAAEETSSNEAVESFNSKWHLQLHPDREFIMQLLFDTSLYIQKHPKVKLQELTLSDLPPEIIARVLELSDEESTRKFGETSRYFREVASRFAYQSWRLMLSDISIDWDEVRRLREDPAAEDPLTTMLEKSYAKCIRQRDYLVQREDILQSLTRLHTGIVWDSHSLSEEEFRDTYTSSFNTLVHSILIRAPNLRSLHVVGIVMAKPLLEAILSLQHLYKVTFSACDFEAVGSELPISNSILNVQLVPPQSPVELSTIWQFIGSCSNIRVVSVDERQVVDVPLPVAVIAQHSPFKTLQRLFLNRVSRFEVLDFAEVLQLVRAASNWPLQLTHLKVNVVDGLSRDDIITILGALQGAPLQCLVLDGTLYAGFDLFDAIAQHFPHLRSLVVLWRDSLRQTESKRARWPHASWEYAPHLQGFSRLEHFGWNFEASGWFEGAAAMLDFEEGFPVPTRSRLEDEDNSYEWKSVTRVIAAYCRSILLVTLLDGRSPVRQCDVVRNEDGEVVGVSSIDIWSPKNSEYYPDFYIWPWEVKTQVSG